MDKVIESLTTKNINSAKLDTKSFFKIYNSSKYYFIDVRTKEEFDIWKFNFGINIPLNELSQRLDEIPKEKLIIIACLNNTRSTLAWLYLLSKGYNVKYLTDGLLGVAKELKGEAIKSFDNYKE